MDKINDKYGEFVITPALMMGMDETIIDWISFGRGKESYQTIRNGLVRPLLRIKGRIVAWAGCQAVYPAG